MSPTTSITLGWFEVANQIGQEILNSAKEGENEGLRQLADACLSFELEHDEVVEYARLLESFDLRDDPKLKMQVAQIYARLGFLETCGDVLQELANEGFLPAMHNLAILRRSRSSKKSKHSESDLLLERAASEGYLPSIRDIHLQKRRKVKIGFVWIKLTIQVMVANFQLYLKHPNYFKYKFFDDVGKLKKTTR